MSIFHKLFYFLFEKNISKRFLHRPPVKTRRPEKQDADLASVFTRFLFRVLRLPNHDISPVQGRSYRIKHWIHTVNASNWNACAPKEENILYTLRKETGCTNLFAVNA